MVNALLNPNGVISDTQSGWLATTVPVLKNQLVFESDTAKFKIGDGVSLYSQLPYVQENLSGIDISNALVTVPGTVIPQTLSSISAAVPLILLFGGVGDGVTDNGIPQAGQTLSPFQLMNNYLENNLLLDLTYQVDFGGLTFATSQPWTPPSGCYPSNGGIIALPSSAWTSGLDTTVVAPLMITNANVSPKNFMVDCNSNSYWGVFVTSSSGFSPSGLKIQHWISTIPVNDLYSSGGLLLAGGKISGGDGNSSRQYTTASSFPNWSGYAVALVHCADCHFGQWTFSRCGIPIYIDEKSFACVFENCHPFNGGSGTVIQDVILMDYRGYNCVFNGIEWDSGSILINITANSNAQNPPQARLTLGPCTWINGTANSTYPAYIRIRTTQTGTTLDNLYYSGQQINALNTIPMESYESYGPQTATATVSGAVTNSNQINLSNYNGTPQVGNLVQGFGVPALTTIVGGGVGQSWHLSSNVTLTAGTLLTFNSLVGTFAPSVNTGNIVYNQVRRTGTTENVLNNSNYGGVGAVYGNILGQRTTNVNTLTALQTDSGCLVTVNNPGETFLLPNNLTQSTWFYVSTVATGGTTITAENGASINGVVNGSATLGFGTGAHVTVVDNSSGTSAKYSVLSVNTAIVPGATGAVPQSGHANNYTMQLSDLYTLCFANTSNVQFSLINTATVGTFLYFSTNSSGVTLTPLNGSGAKLAGEANVTLPIEKGAIVMAMVTNNVDGISANWSVLGLGVSINTEPTVGVSPSSSPFTYTATQYGTLVQTGGTGSAVFLRPGNTAVPLPGINMTMHVSPGDEITSTYTTAPTITFIPD